MKNIILLPLDERPCNFDFPSKIFNGEKYTIIRPEHLGQKKTPASYEFIRDFLLANIEKADAAVISIDTLLYGGLIPSRLHHLSEEAVLERLMLLKELREKNPQVKLYAFQCIMRCPKYSSDDEEPDYYELYGKEIHHIGRLTHLEKLGMGDADELSELKAKVDPAALKDYLDRRAFNGSFNIRTLDLVEDGTIGFLIIPQDDSAKYGYTAMDQKTVRAKIDEKVLNDRVILYPGADELGMVLVSRAINALENNTPRVYLKYASTLAPQLIPNYEDRSLNETVKYHVMAAGCIAVPSLADAEIVTEYCIGAAGPVRTVVLLSGEPIETVRRVFLDAHSLTSVQLAGYLLAKHWKVSPEYYTMEDYAQLDHALPGDAFLLIGDKVFDYEGRFAYSYDLAAEWKKATRLPFAFAVWIARKGVDPDLTEGLQHALTFGIEHTYEAVLEYGFDRKPYDAYGYLTQNIDYIFDNQKHKALQKFWNSGIKVSPRANPG